MVRNHLEKYEKDMVEWIESNCESFKKQVFMAMISRDIDFDTWLWKVQSNDYIGDKFCLSALCQMCQRHALVVTSNKVWTTIPPNFNKNDDEIRWLCDIHMLYVCKDTYTILKPVFEWKREIPIGEVSLLNPETSDPLQDTTQSVLSRESNDQNVIEIKHETDPVPTEPEDQLGLVNIPTLPSTDHSLPDAMVNLLVDLPGVDPQPADELPTDATPMVPTHDEEGKPIDATPQVYIGDDEPGTSSHVVQPVKNTATSIPCSIVIRDVSAKLKGKTSVVFPPSKEEMSKAKVCLERVDRKTDNLPQLRGRKRQRSQGSRPIRKAKSDAKYVFTDTTSAEETKSEQNVQKSDKSSPSGYRLAAHRYMVAKKQGLIEGPRTRTRALKITRTKQESSDDSDATLDYQSEVSPPVRKRKKDSEQGPKVLL